MQKILFFIAFAALCYQCENDKPTTQTVAIQTDTLLTATESQGCGYENEVADLGIGLIIPDSAFQIFEDSLLQHKKGSYVLDNVREKDGICPLFYKPDYGVLTYVCISKNKKYYTIIINEKEVKYMPIANGNTFITWHDYILKYSIRSQSNAFLTAPNDNAETVSIDKEGTDSFCPIAVKGDWVQVQYDCNDDMDSCKKRYLNTCKPAQKGWIRWRKGNKLLVSIPTLC
jgi:hypothetical protein